jgi:putative FmdB family regulatory protein
MPTYQYICEKCGHEFEKFQPISAKALEVCPKELCAKKSWAKGRVKRAITGGAGLIFKGSGFYITDYRSEKYKEAAKKDSAAPASADGKPAAAKEKPAATKSESSATKSTTSKS